MNSFITVNSFTVHFIGTLNPMRMSIINLFIFSFHFLFCLLLLNNLPFYNYAVLFNHQILRKKKKINLQIIEFLYLQATVNF